MKHYVVFFEVLTITEDQVSLTPCFSLVSVAWSFSIKHGKFGLLPLMVYQVHTDTRGRLTAHHQLVNDVRL